MNETKEMLNASILTNAKLAKAVEILMGYHLSIREKESISRRIDACEDLPSLEGTMNLINMELKNGFIDADTGEKWSPKFVEDIKMYYESGFPFNPLTKVLEHYSIIKEFVVLNEIYLKLNEGEAKTLMEHDMAEKKAACTSAMQEMDDLLSGMEAGVS